MERSDEGVSAQCEKLADISDFTFDYDLIDGQSAMVQMRSSFQDRLIEMARQRSRLEVRAGTCAARRMHYQKGQYPYMQLSVQSRANEA